MSQQDIFVPAYHAPQQAQVVEEVTEPRNMSTDIGLVDVGFAPTNLVPAPLLKMHLTKKQKEDVVNMLAGNHTEDEVLEKYSLHSINQDAIVEIMFVAGYCACPNCNQYVESGEMYVNPEDESDYVCDACGKNWGW